MIERKRNRRSEKIRSEDRVRFSSRKTKMQECFASLNSPQLRNRGHSMGTVNIVFPVKNDETRLIRGIRRTSDFCEEYFRGRYRITIADCGSADGTERMSRAIAAGCANVEYIPKQEGCPVMETVLLRNTCDIIGFLNLDLSAGLEHLLYADQMFEDGVIEAVNGSRFRRFSILKVQKKFWRTACRVRRAARFLLSFQCSDPFCPFKLFRRETAEVLYPLCSRGPFWLECAELLFYTEQSGVSWRELTVDWINPSFTSKELCAEKKEFRKGFVRFWLLLRKWYR